MKKGGANRKPAEYHQLAGTHPDNRHGPRQAPTTPAISTPPPANARRVVSIVARVVDAVHGGNDLSSTPASCSQLRCAARASLIRAGDSRSGWLGVSR